jgi:hypothetical protein
VAEILERLQQAPEGGRLKFVGDAAVGSRGGGRATSLKSEGVGESLCLADALQCHPEPGRRVALRHASDPVAATGPYDAIFSTRRCEDRDVASD